MSAIEAFQYQRAASMLQSWKRPLILTHTRPDGDALGCVLAMRSIVRGLGGSPLSVLFDPVPRPYAFMNPNEPLAVFGQEMHPEELGEVDGVVVVDTCAYEQLTPLADWLKGAGLPILAVDHHVTRDVVTAAELIDTGASAAALIVYDWAQAMSWRLEARAASALLVGMATDTGWFSFANTEARTLQAAAELVRGGVDAHDLFVRLYRSEHASRVRLLGEALQTLELVDDERVALMHLSREAFARCDARPSDTEGIINEPLRIASVEISILLVDHGDGVIRTSFRSKGTLDVAAIAAGFGGGGHRNAAGARLRGNLSQARDRVLKRILAAAGS